MRKFMVVSGFLGSGKTTAMMALTDYLNRSGTKAYMISNDLGRKGLADYRYSSACGCAADELTGECICYQTENLVERLRRLYTDGGCEMIMSDIPGFGVGALEHVYHKLAAEYPDECTLAPFTVVTEGAVLRKLMTAASLVPQNAGPGSNAAAARPEKAASDPEDRLAEGGAEALSDDMIYILRTQLEEADLIVLNKTDLYSNEEQEGYLSYLREAFPETPVMCISAADGTGIPELAEYIISHEACMKHPDIGYGGDEFSAAMGRMSEYNCQYYAEVCCETFDANDYLKDLAEEIGARLREKGCEIPHLKLFAQSGDGDICKADLLGAGRETVLTRKLKSRCTDLPVVINASAAAPSAVLASAIDKAILDVSGKYQLSVIIFYKECFGLTDQGRI